MEKQIQLGQLDFEQLTHKFDDLALPTELLALYEQKIVLSFAYSGFIKKVALQYPQSFSEALSRIDYAYKTLNNQDGLLNISYYESDHTKLSEQLTALAQTAITPQALELQAGAIVRQFRHIHMLEIAYFDIHKLQTIETSLLAVSQLANSIINAANTCLHEAMCKRYGSPENTQPLLIMAMGKLGGNELNFSSDIDLIFTYPEQGETQGQVGAKKSIEHQVFFTRLAQKLITMLDQITQDGFAYRVDMRLRPMGESGPLVLPFSALEGYYQEQGRQWERFAMQKMRIVNETPYNQSLYDIIKPFVYRKYIDFTTIESIREMKELIGKEVRRRQISHNIKLGQGGIREVEFFIQSLQLVHAGRHADCQLTSILRSMQALQTAQLTGNVNMLQLKSDYLYLRQVEHYLQIFNDEQTQTLPFLDNKTGEAIALVNQKRLSTLLDDANYAQSNANINECMVRIHEVFKSIVKDANKSQTLNDSSVDDSDKNGRSTHTKQNIKITSALDDIWQLSLQKSEAIEALEKSLSEDTAETFIDYILKFKKKTERAGVSPRALKSINKLMPLLLSEIVIIEGEFDDDVFIDQAQGIFDILQTICGRVTYIDLLLEHPEVRHRLLHLCKKSLWVAQQIAQYPILLDELLHPLYLDKNELSLTQWKAQCADQLRQFMLRVDIQDEEQTMDRLREFKHTSQLRIAAADISGTLAINQVSDKLTLLAEVIMQQVIDLAWQQIVSLFGQPTLPAADTNSHDHNKQIALVAYGKFGGIELSYGSDLDVVFLHNADLSLNTDTTGSRKQLSNQEFYIKLVQRICHICTTKTYNGILYDIDLRLRPSGNSGLLVSHIDTFLHYQESTAWTWEHQALVRSRVVVSNPSLALQFKEVRQTILCKTRNSNELKQQVLEMREKMRSHLETKLPNQVDIKQTKGGIVDVEFMVQYWILANAHKHPEITKWSDNLRLLDALLAIDTIDNIDQQKLTSAYLTLRHATHRIQLANRKLARGGNKLSKKLMKGFEDVQHAFNKLFG
ncbi:MAG: glutamate-ammonia-ligase adenylyltransferase [Alphaproteobacteria bacterium]